MAYSAVLPRKTAYISGRGKRKIMKNVKLSFGFITIANSDQLIARGEIFAINAESVGEIACPILA